ncbi:MAG: WD40/YVTN/BNR-like repeat-containing protein [Caulobacteraceae bacterium]
MPSSAAPLARPAWVKLRTVPYTLNNKQDAIAFVSPDVGWYGNGLGRIYETTDGGRAWREIFRKRGSYVRALEFIDARTGFMGNVGPGYFPGVTDPNPLYVTRNGGFTWTPVPAPRGPKMAGVCAIDILRVKGRVVAIRAAGRVGGPAAMMESFDGGRTWASRDMSRLTGMILDIKFVSRSTGFIAGATASDERRSHAQVLKTSDGGRTWRTVYRSRRPMENTWKLAFPTPDIGYVTVLSYDPDPANVRRFVAKTEDAGETWRELPVADDKALIEYGVAFVDARHGWVGGDPGGYETRDGGLSWRPARMGVATNKIRILPTPGGGLRLFSVGKAVWRLDLPAGG